MSVPDWDCVSLVQGLQRPVSNIHFNACTLMLNGPCRFLLLIAFDLEICIMRSFVFALYLLVPSSALFAAHSITPNPSSLPPAPSANPLTVHGVVGDPTGAIIPGAEIDLVDASGATDGTIHSGGDGSFQITAPRAGHYTLVVSEPGFGTTQTPVAIGTQTGPVASAQAAAALRIVLHIASVGTTVQVNSESNQDLTATDENRDSSVMTASELKSLPIFDNDYVTAMSSFLDSDVAGTGGSGLIVDGVEANRATVSASAVQEIRINQDP